MPFVVPGLMLAKLLFVPTWEFCCVSPKGPSQGALCGSPETAEAIELWALGVSVCRGHTDWGADSPQLCVIRLLIPSGSKAPQITLTVDAALFISSSQLSKTLTGGWSSWGQRAV